MKTTDQPDHSQVPCCRHFHVNHLQGEFFSMLEFTEFSVLLQCNLVYSALSLGVAFILLPLLD